MTAIGRPGAVGKGEEGYPELSPDLSEARPNGRAAKSPLLDQRRNLPVAAMAKQGFINYAEERWHFSMPGAPGGAYDFPIVPRRP